MTDERESAEEAEEANEAAEEAQEAVAKDRFTDDELREIDKLREMLTSQSMTDTRPTESDLNDLVAFLRAKWDEQEAEATAVLAEAQRFYPVSDGFTVRYDWAVATSHRSGGYGVFTRRGAPSPQDMLTDIAAKRQVLQLLIDDPHLVIEECSYTCAAAIEDTAIEGNRTDDLRQAGPCDCGRDRRLETAVRLFAATYPDHPRSPTPHGETPHGETQ